jgi:hypothetical protein
MEIFTSPLSQLWQWVESVCDPVRSVTTKPNRNYEIFYISASELAQVMDGTTAGALIPVIMLRGFQELL